MPLVIEASRDFVCIRLTTYENKEEHAFMEKLYSKSKRPVENTTFSILSHDAKHVFVTPSRGARFAFRNADHMASTLFQISSDYRNKLPMSHSKTLPIAASVKIGLNIAASDKQPLLVIVGKDEKEQKRLETQMQTMIWKKGLIGKFALASTTNNDTLDRIKDGDKLESGYHVIQPDNFGMKGEVLASIQSNATSSDAFSGIHKGLTLHQKPAEVNHRSHIQNGISSGVFWETNLPVTDRMEARARQRTKQMIEQAK